MREEFNMLDIVEVMMGDTIQASVSDDFRDRFLAEYWQTRIRLNKLHVSNVREEAECRVMDRGYSNEICYTKDDEKRRSEKYTLNQIMRDQEEAMTRYLYLLELRAQLLNIDLNPINLKKDKKEVCENV